MKSILFKAVILLSAVLILFSCAEKANEGDPKDPNDIVMNYANIPVSTLQDDLIKVMKKNYTEGQLKIINENMEFDNDPKKLGDAQSVWYDLETLKKFIYHIERNAKKKNANVTDSDLGIRFYYSSYPKHAAWKSYPDLASFNGDKSDEYGLRHTLVMIPTLKNEEGKNTDFSPNDEETKTSKKSIKNTSAVVQKIGKSSVALNHGAMIPPAK